MKSFFMRNKSFLAGLAVLFVVRGTFADHNVVPSGSMEPTIEVGDHLFVNRVAYDLKLPFSDFRLMSLWEPNRGDIIVFHNPQSDLRMVKRLIGLPGDHIRVRDGFVWINGTAIPGSQDGQRAIARSSEAGFIYQEQIDAHLASIKRIPLMSRPDEIEVVVPAGMYFAMGDNRDNSYDSRGWGFIPRTKIIGRAEGVIYNMRWDPNPRVYLKRTLLKFS